MKLLDTVDQPEAVLATTFTNPGAQARALRVLGVVQAAAAQRGRQPMPALTGRRFWIPSLSSIGVN